MEIREVSPYAWGLSRDELFTHLANLPQLLAQARLTPYFTGGEPDGFRITNLVPQSFLERLGLRNGDILQGIDGQKFESLDDVLVAYQHMHNASFLQVEVARDQRREILTYELR